MDLINRVIGKLSGVDTKYKILVAACCLLILYVVVKPQGKPIENSSANLVKTLDLPSVPTQKPILTIFSTPTPTASPRNNVEIRKVMVIDFNPTIESKGGKKLRSLMGWNDPMKLESQYISDINEVSGGYVSYEIVDRLSDIDAYPMKSNGFVFNDDGYLKSISDHDGNAEAIIDYPKVLKDFGVCDRVNSGEIDELWLWGGPWFGYYEAAMAGPGAYFTNSPPINSTGCKRKLIIMGFSYERGISEMLEDFGHAMEGTLTNVYGEEPRFGKNPAKSPWGRFVKSCGWMHFAPNSTSDYDWGNKSQVRND